MNAIAKRTGVATQTKGALMPEAYGVYLLFTLGCTFYAIYRWCSKTPTVPVGKEVTYAEKIRIERKAKAIAFLIVAALYWFQDGDRHRWSPEAEAMKAFDKLLDQWEAGQKSAVMSQLDQLSNAERPWHAVADTSEE
jgi:hypothetical protein